MEKDERGWRLGWTPTRRDFLKVAGAGISMAAFGSLIEACSSSSASSISQAGGTVRLAMPYDVTTTDPAVEGGTYVFTRFVYETVTSIQDDLTVGPGAASSWEQPSPNRYIFHLRSGLTFSNGRSLTASDVVGSIRRTLDPKTNSIAGAQLGPVTNVTAVDDKTVQVDLGAAFTPLLAALASPAGVIYPMEELNAGTFDPAKELLGAGPFMVANHEKNVSWSLDRNPHYWRSGYPKPDHLSVQIISDQSARIAALSAGTIDMTVFDDPSTPSLLKGISNVRVVPVATTSYIRMDLNAVNPSSPFRDVAVRRAVSMAIDRNQIRDIAMAGSGSPSAQIAPAFHIASPGDLQYSQHNPAMAKQLLQSAGATNLKFNLIASTGQAAYPKVAQVIQQNLAAIGVQVTILQLDQGVAVQRCFVDSPGSFDAAIWQFVGNADPAVAPSWYNPVPKVGWDKGLVVDDPAADQLLEQAQSLPNGSARTNVLRQLVTALDANCNILGLVTLPGYIAYRTDQITPRIQVSEGLNDWFKHAPEYIELKKS